MSVECRRSTYFADTLESFLRRSYIKRGGGRLSGDEHLSGGEGPLFGSLDFVQLECFISPLVTQIF